MTIFRKNGMKVNVKHIDNDGLSPLESLINSFARKADLPLDVALQMVQGQGQQPIANPDKVNRFWHAVERQYGSQERFFEVIERDGPQQMS